VIIAHPFQNLWLKNMNVPAKFTQVFSYVDHEYERKIKGRLVVSVAFAN